jgi:hypothetical protein
VGERQRGRREKGRWRWRQAADLLQPKLKRDLAALQKWKEGILIPNEKTVVEFFDTRKELQNLKQEIRNIANQPIHSLTFLNPGMGSSPSFLPSPFSLLPSPCPLFFPPPSLLSLLFIPSSPRTLLFLGSVLLTTLGRLVHIKDLKTGIDWGLGVCINFQKKKSTKEEKAGMVVIENAPKYIIDVLLRCHPGRPQVNFSLFFQLLFSLFPICTIFF